MDSKLQETNAALAAYIEKQQALLARARADVERLYALRARVIADAEDDSEPEDPDAYFEQLRKEMDDPAFRLSEQLDMAEGPPEIDWSLFPALDPAAFEALRPPAPPSAPPVPPPSSFRSLTAHARTAILKPALEGLSPPLTPSPEPEPTPAEKRRARAREQIRAMLTVPGAGGVHVRRDVGDESAEVDVWAGEDAADSRMAVDPAPPPARTRRPTDKVLAKRRPSPQPSQSKRKRVPSSSPPRLKEDDEEVKEEIDTRRGRDRGKPKPETYKQVWSVSEQHLLERLLEEIPDGSKNRWQQISRAMGGRRTPRQVASRVQKYFAKLKRLGIDEEL